MSGLLAVALSFVDRDRWLTLHSQVQNLFLYRLLRMLRLELEVEVAASRDGHTCAQTGLGPP
jgi:hypothetical protein